jgi:hypothetical protein
VELNARIYARPDPDEDGYLVFLLLVDKVHCLLCRLENFVALDLDGVQPNRHALEEALASFISLGFLLLHSQILLIGFPFLLLFHLVGIITEVA